MTRVQRTRAIVALVLLLGLGGVVIAAVKLAQSRPRIHPSGESYRAPTARSRWRDVQAANGHAAHLTGPRALACADCHDIQAKAFQPPDASRCAKCHPDTHPTIHLGLDSGATGGAVPEPRQCLSCHPFVDRGNGASPWGCIRCHDKAQGTFGVVAVHAKEACGGCHKPHATPALEATPCVDCHRELRTHHGAKQGAAVSLCVDCHQPHEKAGTADAKCVGCHVAGAGAGEAGAVRIAAAAGRVAAAGGNAPKVKPTAVSPGKHERCTGCHQPHEFTADHVRSCRDCHAKQITLGQSTTRAHDQCTSCHDPHEPRGAGIAASCQRCHAKLQPTHPRDPVNGSCLGCHEVHPPQVQASVAKPCSTCHTKAASDTAFHVGNATCRSCHNPHDFKAKVPDACGKCHSDKLIDSTAGGSQASSAGRAGGNAPRGVDQVRRTAGNGHRACTGCHVAHAPKTPAKACATCHADKGALVAANRGHQTCIACHQNPHAPKQAMATCKSCHTVEAQTAPKGHLECIECHEPHRGALRAPPPAACAKCHADRTTGPHRSVKGSCITCHRGHGPNGPATPPVCTTCHEPKALPALHQKVGHSACAACHTSHGGPRGDRATCMTCHTDRKNHEPAATSCVGCHNFRGAK